MARLLYWAHLQRLDDGDILKLASEYQVPGPFKHGRPCFTWATCVDQDIACSGVTPDYLRGLAQDRGRFKKFAQEHLPQMCEEVPSEPVPEADGDYDTPEINLLHIDDYSSDSDESLFEGFSAHDLPDFLGFDDTD